MRGFRKSKNKQILKVTSLYLMWNPEICQDPPSWGQDDLVLLSTKDKNIVKLLPLGGEKTFRKTENLEGKGFPSTYSYQCFYHNCGRKISKYFFSNSTKGHLQKRQSESIQV